MTDRPTVVQHGALVPFVVLLCACGARSALDDVAPADAGPVDAGPPRDPGPRVQQLSAGWRHTCAVSAGELFCWGHNASGQLGDGSLVDRSEPVRVRRLDGVVVEVSAGLQHTCALLADGEVFCWGSNALGQIGDGTFDMRAFPRRVWNVSDAIGVAAAGEHTCALLASGEAKCWGHNAWSQLGDGTTVVRPTAVPVVALRDAIHIDAGRRHTCALRRDGSVWCWGFLDGTPTAEATPIGWTRDVRQVSAGMATTCVLENDGDVACDGALRVVREGRHVAAGDTFGCAVDARGVTCWGAAAPRDGRVPGTEGAFQVAVGYEHACARLPTSTACFGRDDFGQLGDGPTVAHSTVTLPHL